MNKVPLTPLNARDNEATSTELRRKYCASKMLFTRQGLERINPKERRH